MKKRIPPAVLGIRGLAKKILTWDQSSSLNPVALVANGAKVGKTKKTDVYVQHEPDEEVGMCQKLSATGLVEYGTKFSDGRGSTCATARIRIITPVLK